MQGLGICLSVCFSADGSHLAETDAWLSRASVCACLVCVYMLLEHCHGCYSSLQQTPVHKQGVHSKLR